MPEQGCRSRYGERRSQREPPVWESDCILEPLGILSGRMIENRFVLAIPIHLPTFAIAARRHDHGDRVSKPRIDVAVGWFAIAHRAEPIVRMILEVVVLVHRG